MYRLIVCSLLMISASSILFGEELPDSPRSDASQRIDTMFVIPAGPVAGAFSNDCRMQIMDTVAGWAKIQVEGWVPVGLVLDRFESSNNYNLNSNAAPTATKAVRQQCTAITKKGTRCSRMAQPGTDRCWQHQRGK